MGTTGSLWGQREVEAVPTLGLVPIHHADGLDQLQGGSTAQLSSAEVEVAGLPTAAAQRFLALLHPLLCHLAGKTAEANGTRVW